MVKNRFLNLGNYDLCCIHFGDWILLLENNRKSNFKQGASCMDVDVTNKLILQIAIYYQINITLF